MAHRACQNVPVSNQLEQFIIPFYQQTNISFIVFALH